MAANPSTRAPKVTHERPIPIALVNLGGLLPISLKSLANDLNRIKNQKLFSFHAVAEKVPLPNRTLPHGYTLRSLYALIKDKIKGTGYSFGIGITHEVLEDARFNWHDQKSGIGVITTDQSEVYNPVGRTLYQYLAYLVLCEALCITGKTQFEHSGRNYCLFDMCMEKSDIKKCLTNPFIHCTEKLKEAGFTDEDIESANGILAYVKRLRFTDVLQHVFTKPIVGILIGILVKSIAELIYSLPKLWNFEINLFFFLVIDWLLLREYMPKSRKK